jgi:hypothetical protein
MFIILNKQCTILPVWTRHLLGVEKHMFFVDQGLYGPRPVVFGFG